MAFILIFICSMIGLFLAAVQVVILENGYWQAFTTYLSFAVGYPIAFLLFLWALDTVRTFFVSHSADHTDPHSSAASGQTAG